MEIKNKKTYSYPHESGDAWKKADKNVISSFFIPHGTWLWTLCTGAAFVARLIA